LRRATQTMREEMNEAVSVERRTERVTDVVFCVSGVTLSVGSLAWLLHGGSLFASALSTIPAWKINWLNTVVIGYSIHINWL
jgi:hypothetical protein